MCFATALPAPYVDVVISLSTSRLTKKLMHRGSHTFRQKPSVPLPADKLTLCYSPPSSMPHTHSNFDLRLALFPSIIDDSAVPPRVILGPPIHCSCFRVLGGSGESLWCSSVPVHLESLRDQTYRTVSNITMYVGIFLF